MIVVAKIGTSRSPLRTVRWTPLRWANCARKSPGCDCDGHTVVVVTSGAVTAGVAAIAPAGGYPNDPKTLQALSAIGQPRLMRVYEDALGAAGLLAGQVLLAPLDFVHRQRYLHARDTFSRLLELGVVPIVNENDADCRRRDSFRGQRPVGGPGGAPPQGRSARSPDRHRRAAQRRSASERRGDSDRGGHRDRPRPSSSWRAARLAARAAAACPPNSPPRKWPRGPAPGS